MDSEINIVFVGGSNWQLRAAEADAEKFLSDYYTYINDATAVLGADFDGKSPFRVRVASIAGVFLTHP